LSQKSCQRCVIILIEIDTISVVMSASNKQRVHCEGLYDVLVERQLLLR